MDTKKKLERLSDEDFQMYLGVKRKTFYDSLEVLENQSAIEHKNGGKPIKTSIFERLVITLNYYCEYRTMRRLAIDHGISKSNVCKIIHWTEDALINSGLFALQSKDCLADGKVHCILIDASEVEVERPEKDQELYYSGKKKKHTLKFQLVVDIITMHIICCAFAPGSVHDFELFKQSNLPCSSMIKAVADSGYQGINQYYICALIPIKASKNHPLTPEEKQYNRELSQSRIYVEHTNRYLKRFKILSYRYRNKLRDFDKRVTLIAGIYNYQN